jgi:hypothetical protein
MTGYRREGIDKALKIFRAVKLSIEHYNDGFILLYIFKNTELRNLSDNDMSL